MRSPSLAISSRNSRSMGSWLSHTVDTTASSTCSSAAPHQMQLSPSNLCGRRFSILCPFGRRLQIACRFDQVGELVHGMSVERGLSDLVHRLGVLARGLGV